MESHRRWRIRLIHHSHTDVGYTDRQERIEANQVDYLRQVLAILGASRDGSHPEWQGFRWTCESFWAVERFWREADAGEKASFIAWAREGLIEVEAGYLNLCELAGLKLFSRFLDRAKRWAAHNDLPMESAMIVDVNGFSWGWAQALADQGVRNLLCSVHSYRGYFPGWIKQRPFWWETPQGDRILVWNGEHYQLGNEFGLIPEAVMSWTLAGDEFQGRRPADEELSLTRMGRYLDRLEAEGYPYDFVPVMVHGLATDNAPPNPRLMPFIKDWNARHGGRIELGLTTPTAFFGELRAAPVDIPVYRGDWPDWWSDGVASTPRATSIFRETQREWERLSCLDPEGRHLEPSAMDEAAYRLMLFAEHTWGLHSSVQDPWNPLVNLMVARKEAFATEANALVGAQRDRLARVLGEAPLSADRPLSFIILDDGALLGPRPVLLELEAFEHPPAGFSFILMEAETHTTATLQATTGPRGKAWLALLEHEAGKARRFTLVPQAEEKAKKGLSAPWGGVDGVIDISIPGDSPATGLRFGGNCLESDLVRISWEPGQGIRSWFDKSDGREWIDGTRRIGAFTPIYERTPATPDLQMTVVRNRMGRNRKGSDVVRTSGSLIRISLKETGPLFARVELGYEVAGCRSFAVLLTLYAGISRVDVVVKLQKDAIWEPENLFLALPFTAGKGEDILISKAGTPVRLWKDQIAGSLTDYYAVGEGFVLEGPEVRLAVAMPDSPLLQVGSLEHGPRLLQGHPGLAARRPEPCAWLLSNHWETNFKASTEGFHVFRFSLQAGVGLDWCGQVCTEPLVLRGGAENVSHIERQSGGQ